MKALWLGAVMVAAATGLMPMAHAADPTDAQIDAAFRKADPDNDGTVDRNEAHKFGITRAAFDHANPDKDETLDKKEFLAAVTWQFNQANPDNDGTLDRKEAQKAGIKSRKTFDAANPDKDGTLDPAEYLDALRRQAK